MAERRRTGGCLRPRDGLAFRAPLPPDSSRHLIHFDTVIWDFNGTLIDDVTLAVDAVNVVLQRRNVAPIDAERHRATFGHPVSGYYAALGMELDDEQLLMASGEFHQQYLAGVKQCAPVDGSFDLLNAFRAAGIRQFLLSAAEQGMLEDWVRMLDMEPYFEGVYGLADTLAKTKVIRGQQLVADYDIDTANTVVVGDTDHDVEVARELGCAPLVIASGHQNLQRLQATGATVYPSLRALGESRDLQGALVVRGNPDA